MMVPIGSIDFFLLEDGDPMVRLVVEAAFHDMPPVERVRFLVAISQVAFLASQEVAQQNPDDAEEITEMMQSVSIEPFNSMLN